ncbi:MAG: amidohydrolase [Epulopiscium sp.]|jgi:5-methylthioadenosine/S-adenosylhomocysteine deaminase|nr:amidohydrolase [Candidatus Epulonipiscium sp.]
MLFSNINYFSTESGQIHCGYVQVLNEKIVYVGEKKPKIHENEEIYDGTDKLLLPGFINTHCHAPMTLLRSIGADLPLQRWLHEKIFPIEKKLTESYSYTGTMLGIAELLRSGVTSFSDMYVLGKSRCDAVLESGINANICMGIVCFDDKNFQEAPFVQDTIDMIKEYHNTNHGQLQIDVGIHAEYTSTPNVVRGAAELAFDNKCNVQLHLCETQQEVEACHMRHHKSPVQYFSELGIFKNNTTAAHCVYLTENDLELLSAHQVSVAHCPMSNLKLGSGIADIVKMQAHNINVTIGTDGTASNDNLNYIEDMKLAALLQKGYHKDPSVIPASTLLKMATCHGAVAQGRTNTGKICQGFDADLVVIDFNSINLQPQTEPLTEMIYAALPSDVALTMVRGKILYQNGQFPTIDIEKILFDAKKIGETLYPLKNRISL